MKEEIKRDPIRDFSRSFQMSEYIENVEIEFSILQTEGETQENICASGCLFFLPYICKNDFFQNIQVALVQSPFRKGDEVGRYDNLHNMEEKKCIELLTGIDALIVAYVWKYKNIPSTQEQAKKLVEIYHTLCPLSHKIFTKSMLSPFDPSMEKVFDILMMNKWEREVICDLILKCMEEMEGAYNPTTSTLRDFLTKENVYVYYNLKKETEINKLESLNTTINSCYGKNYCINTRTINFGEKQSDGTCQSEIKLVATGFTACVLNYIAYTTANLNTPDYILFHHKKVDIQSVKILLNTQEAFKDYYDVIFEAAKKVYENRPEYLQDDFPNLYLFKKICDIEVKEYLYSKTFYKQQLTENQQSDLNIYEMAFLEYAYKRMIEESNEEEKIYLESNKILFGDKAIFIVQKGKCIKQIYSTYMQLIDKVPILSIPETIKLLNELIANGMVQIPQQYRQPSTLQKALEDTFNMKETEGSSFRKAFSKLSY